LDFSPEELENAFVAANSNPDFVGGLLADLTRKLMRASLSSAPAGAVTEAAVSFTELLRYLGGFDGEKVRQAMSIAASCLRVEHRRQPDIAAARSGARFLIEKSATDAFSEARACEALSSFRTDMRHAMTGERDLQR
jgi:hypothetical protein